MSEPRRCPTCHQPWPVGKAVRICYACEQPIRRHDKWFFDGARVRHRNCANPELYVEDVTAAPPPQTGMLPLEASATPVED